MKKLLLIMKLLLVILLFAVPATAAELDTEALGNDGEMHRLLTGRYGELFPGGSDLSAAAKVLALDTVWPDGTSERLLVPATGDDGAETPVAVFFDRDFATVTVLWRPAGTLLAIASLDRSGWTETVTIDDPDGASSTPLLVLERERFEIELAPNRWQLVDRDLLHMVWQVTDSDGAVDVRYSPLAFIDGYYVGDHEVYSLRDLTRDKDGVPTAFTAPLDMQRGEQGELFVTFVNGLDGQLTIAQVGVLPLEAVYYAEEARAVLLGMEDVFATGDLHALAGRARIQLIAVGRRSRSAFRQTAGYVSSEIEQEILTSGGRYERYNDLVDHLYGFTLEKAMPMADVSVSLGEDGVAEIGLGEFLERGNGWTPLVQVTARRELPVPSVAGAVEIYVSRDGRDVLASWESQGRTHYVESTPGGAGWSVELTLGEGLTGDAARRVLERRVR